MFSFRIRFDRSPTDRIGIAAPMDGLSDAGVGYGAVEIRSAVAGKTIEEAERISVCCSGFQTEQEAEELGRAAMQSLLIALARQRVGADFGARAPFSVITPEGLAHLTARYGRRCLQDIHGVMTFETAPEPLFIWQRATLERTVQAEELKRDFSALLERRPALSTRELLAHDLFNASFFEPSPDARFLLLMMAIESLLEPAARDAAAQTVIDQLIDAVENSDVDKTQKDSLLGSIRHMRSESISQAGRRIAAERIAGRAYRGLSPPKYFTSCYQLRSRLVHGSDPYPTADDVREECEVLEVFVSDLLTRRHLPDD